MRGPTSAPPFSADEALDNEEGVVEGGLVPGRIVAELVAAGLWDNGNNVLVIVLALVALAVVAIFKAEVVFE